MPEAVIMPSLMMMTSTVSEESFAMDTHTHTHTQIWSQFYLKICFANKKKKEEKKKRSKTKMVKPYNSFQTHGKNGLPL